MTDVSEINIHENYFVLDTGSPHLVKFTEHLNDMDVKEEGKKIRYSPEFFQEGINVNFVEVKEGIVHLRTYERGVENETFFKENSLEQKTHVQESISPSLEKIPIDDDDFKSKITRDYSEKQISHAVEFVLCLISSGKKIRLLKKFKK